MARSLHDKVLVITGASSGIGAATAIEAGAHGMKVVLAARRIGKLEEVTAAVRGVGGDAMAVRTDVNDPLQVRDLIDRAVHHFGRLDAIFANAGFGAFHRLIDPTHAELERRMWETNYFAAVECIRAAGRVMIDRKQGGHILICSSVAGLTGLPYKGTYAATKGALHALAASLRVELEEHSIYVSSVYPAATETEFSATAHSLSGPHTPRPHTPRVALQTPEHVARCIVSCLRRPRPEVWPSRASHGAAVTWSLFPRLRAASFRGAARDARRRLSEKPREV